MPVGTVSPENLLNLTVCLKDNVSSYCNYGYNLAVWRSGSTLVSINEVTLPWARLLGWVTGPGFNSRARNRPHYMTRKGGNYSDVLPLKAPDAIAFLT